MKILESSSVDHFAEMAAESGKQIDLPRGAVLFSEGEPAPTLDFLMRGAVRLSHPREGAEPLIVGMVRVGQLIEPGPFFLEGLHETSASAVTPCRIIRTDRRTLEELLRSEPGLRVPLLELLYDATEQSVRIARFLRTAHRIPDTDWRRVSDHPTG